MRREEEGLELRGYREGDLEAVARLAAGSLGGSVEGWEEHYEPEQNPRLDLDGVYVVEEDGGIRAMAAVLPLEVFVDGRPVAMGGISDVATHAAYRRRGFAGELMRRALRHMREEGVHLSMLHPFSHAYYRAFGWELATESVRYDLKPTDLPTSPEQERVRAYKDGDFSILSALYEEEASKHPLCLRRGEGRMRQVLEHGVGKGAAVYEGEGGVEGYLLYEQAEGGSGRTLKLPELVAATPEAREALISLAAAFDPLMFNVEHTTPRGEPLHPFLPNSYVDARIEPGFMLRLVDVEGALKLLDRDAEAPLVLEISDDEVPENAGDYTVGGRTGGGVARGAEAEDKAALDVRGLAQLYAGYLAPGQLARRGLVRPSSSRALKLLEQFFPPGDPYVSPPDHF